MAVDHRLRAAVLPYAPEFPNSWFCGVALRLWTGLHGIVLLRLHKPDLDWPTSAENEARQVVQTIVDG